MISNYNVELSMLRMAEHLVKPLYIIIPFLCEKEDNLSHYQ